MGTLKSSAAKRPFIFLLTGLVIWMLSLPGAARAQRVRTGPERGESVASGVIPAGTRIDVRTTQTIDTRDTNGRVYRGVIEHDVFGRDGNMVIPRGADAELIARRISENEIALDLDSVVVNGERYGVETTSANVGTDRDAGIGANRRTGEFVGGGAILGAIIGGIAGGGKGAAIGAGAGAAAGAGAQVLTRGGRINVPAESLLTFQLTQPLRAGVYDPGYMRTGVHYHQGYGNAAYEQGLRDGRAEAQSNVRQQTNVDRFRDSRDRLDYEAGYNDGYQNANGYDYNRQKPGSAGSPWRIGIGPDHNITWQAPSNVKVYVVADNGAPRLFASGQSGTQAAPWMQRGHRYVFILQDENGNEVARTEQDLR